MRDYIAKHEQADNAAKNLVDKTSSSATAVSNLGTSAGSAATSLYSVTETINSLNSKIQSIAIPNLPPVPGKNVPSPTIAKPHAMGGLFTRPHIGLIVERGPELLTPLTRPNRGFGLGGHSFSITSSPVINVGAGSDIGEFKAALEQHARSIADEVRRIIEIDFEREAIV